MNKMKSIYSILAALVLTLFASSCSSELDNMENVGYLRLELNTLVSTHDTRTAKPSDYNPKKLCVKIINAENKVVMETQDVENDEAFKGNIVLDPGKYTIQASSAGWDGSDSAFGAPYYTSFSTATVEAKTLCKATVTLTQANVKVTVKYDENFRTYFTSANCIVTSALEDVSLQRFSLNTVGSAYFPVADLNFLLSVTNKNGENYTMSRDITDVKPRDHYIVNYKIAAAGSLGGVTVKVDDATQSYTFNIEIPRKASIALQANKANAFSNFADLAGAVTAKTSDFNIAHMKLQYKQKSAAEWTELASSELTSPSTDNYTYRLKNLTPATEYVYRLAYNDGQTSVNSNEINFTTEAQTQIENSGFENWYKDGASWMANAEGSTYWSSSNPGSTSMGEQYNVTTPATDFFHSGTYSARLGTQWVVIKLAAASLFTGEFHGLIGTNGAKLKWGVPFTSRPSALKGYYNFKGGAVNRAKTTEAGAPAKGERDAFQIFCAMLTEPLLVGGNVESGDYKKSTAIDWENDPRIIAYGQMTQYDDSPAGTWQELNIPLTYHSTTQQPAYMLIVVSANKWGDYFHGCDSNVLYVDDFSFEYAEPTFK